MNYVYHYLTFFSMEDSMALINVCRKMSSKHKLAVLPISQKLDLISKREEGSSVKHG
jgi:hypothetical protein